MSEANLLTPKRGAPRTGPSVEWTWAGGRGLLLKKSGLVYIQNHTSVFSPLAL